ncbi:MAG: tetratricopeptide repeat protein [Pyrinomonadaceae bacterium]
MRYQECRIIQFLLLAVLLGGGLFSISSCSSQSKQKHLARGEEYLQKRKFQEAVMEFRAAADIDKNSADAHWGLARANENLGQFYEAIEELRRVAELSPDNLEAKAKLGNYYISSQPPQIDETAKILEDIFARDPNFIEGHILKANLLATQGKSEQEVLNILNHAISLNPNRTESYLSLSRYFMKIKKANEAEKAIQKGISVNPNIAPGYLEYGRFLDYTNRAGEADAQLSKAVAVEPKNVEAREAIAKFYLSQKQFDKAETAYKQFVEVQENSPESRVELANFYSQIGREDDALKVFNGIVAEFPEYVRARYRLGEIYLDRKENEKVIAQVEELLKLNNNDAEAFMLRARVKLQENKTDEAVKDLEEVLKKQPSQKNALFYMTQARLSLGQIDQARAFIGDLEKYHPNFLRTKLLIIQADFSENEPENALRQSNELLEAIKRAFPNAETDAQGLEELRVRALTARGLAFLELGKLAAARADLQEIVRLSPSSSAALVNLAKVAVAERNYAEASNLYEKALAADGKNFDALSGLVSISIKQNQFDRAGAKIDNAIQAENGQAEISAALHYLKSNVFLAQKNVPSAEAELKTAIELDENYLPAYSALASLLVVQNKTDEAVQQYNKVIEKKPSASVYTLLGMLEDGRGNTAQAENHYRKALEITPNTPIASNNLAWLIAENQGNLDEALKLAQTAVNRNSNTAGFYDTLGWIYYKKNLYSPAVEQLKRATVLDQAEANRSGQQPTAAYRLRLATALASAGDKTSARREVESSLQNGQNLSEKEMQDAKTLLANL